MHDKSEGQSHVCSNSCLLRHWHLVLSSEKKGFKNYKSEFKEKLIARSFRRELTKEKNSLAFTNEHGGKDKGCISMEDSYFMNIIIRR